MREPFELSRCPLRLGSPLKVPTTAWHRWGISWDDNEEFNRLVAASEAHYAQEWTNSDQTRLDDIAGAAQRAGLADANSRLNAGVAEELAALIADQDQGMSVIDIGAGTGSTTAAILKRIPFLANSGAFALVEPSEESVDAAKQRERFAALARQGRMSWHCTRDLQIEAHFSGEYFDIAVANASLHHHAFLCPVFEVIFRILKPGGFLVVGDWHNSMWLNPGRVLSFLNTLEWQSKNAELTSFAHHFAQSETEEADLAVHKANEQVCSFWRMYAQIRRTSRTPCEVLEGHRPPDDYRRLLSRAGFILLNRERRLMQGSALLCVHTARKP